MSVPNKVIKEIAGEGLILCNETVRDGSRWLRRYATISVTELKGYVDDEDEVKGQEFAVRYFGRSFYEFDNRDSKTWYGQVMAHSSNLELYLSDGFLSAEAAAEHMAERFGVVNCAEGYAVINQSKL